MILKVIKSLWCLWYKKLSGTDEVLRGHAVWFESPCLYTAVIPIGRPEFKSQHSHWPLGLFIQVSYHVSWQVFFLSSLFKRWGNHKKHTQRGERWERGGSALLCVPGDRKDTPPHCQACRSLGKGLVARWGVQPWEGTIWSTCRQTVLHKVGQYGFQFMSLNFYQLPMTTLDSL